MAMLRNHTEVWSDDDNTKELSHDDGRVHFYDSKVSPYDPHKPRQSKFPAIYQEKFQKKYKEIDDAIRSDDWTYLQKLISEKFILNDDEMNLSDAVNLSDDPLLSVVIAHKKSDLALRLVEVMSEENQLTASNIYGDTALHVAAANGDVRVVEKLAMKDGKLTWLRNWKKEIPLHKAALYGQQDQDAFWKLVEIGSEINGSDWDDLGQRREDGSNMLHYAVTGNAPDLAMDIAKKYPELTTSRNTFGATPLHLLLTIPEAFRSKLQLGFLDSIIYYCIPLEKEKPVDKTNNERKESGIPTDEEKQSLITLHGKFPKHCSTLCYLLELIYRFPVTWIRQFVFNVLKQLFPSIQELQEQKQKQRQTKKLIALLAKKPGYWNFYNKGGKPSEINIFYPSNETKQKEGGNSSENKTLLKELVKCCCQKKDATENHVRWTESPLIICAKMGLDEFVEEILDLFPESTSNLDTEEMNVLQVAIKYGHKKITKLILSKISGSNPTIPSGLLSYVHPATGNTILHFAAEKTVKDEGFLLQMQYELQWFEKVRKMVPKDLLHCRNKNEQTAEELFTEKHEDMVKSGKTELTELGKTCSGLVAAVVFASSFSIPGDKDANQDPIFLHRTAFKVFSHAYVIGLSSAAASLVLFLSFLGSSYREQDFRRSLPTKYFLASMSFLIALVALLVAFSCNIYLQIYGGKRAERQDIIPFVCELTFFPTVCLLVVLYRSPITGIKSFLRNFWR
ncbi:uncharacterized protein [Typha angustifolia]|uniref:uncharacterized protein isoform X2 n=1 Tax=Typha angustifolia TaxID=59011 RepID=UPI003C2E0FDF